MSMTRFIQRVLIAALPCFQIVPASAGDIDADTLKARISSRWQALRDHQFETAYQFESPTYRKVFPLRLYLNKFAIGSTSGLKTIEKLEFNPDTGIANALLILKSRSTRNSAGDWASRNPVDLRVREKWIKIDGQWWHIDNG